MRAFIFEEVKSIVVDELEGADTANVTESAGLADLGGGDEMKIIELIMKVEEEFEITGLQELVLGRIPKIQTVGDLVDYIVSEKGVS